MMSSSMVRMACCWVALAALGCGGGDDDEPAGTGGQGGSSSAPTVTFTKDVHPVLVAKCGRSDCHGMANFIQPGHGAADVNLAYTEATKTGQEGAPVYDRILLRTATTTPNFNMPPTYATPPCQGGLGNPGCLTQAEYDLIKTWVDEGHPK